MGKRQSRIWSRGDGGVELVCIEMSEPSLKPLIDAVETRNQPRINKLLGYTPNVSRDGSLRPTTEKGQGVLGCLRRMLTDKRSYKPSNNSEGTRVHLIYYVIMMIYPEYDTPWRAMLDLSNACLDLAFDDLQLCVSVSELFLRDISTQYESGRTYVPSDYLRCMYWIENIVRNVAEPLLSESPPTTLPGSDWDERKFVIQDWLVALAVFSKKIKNESSAAVSKLIYQRDINSTDLLSWVRVLSILFGVATVNERDSFRRGVSRALETNQNVELLKSVSDVILDTVRSDGLDIDVVDLDQAQTWWVLPIQILLRCRERPRDYMTLEAHFIHTHSSLLWKEMQVLADAVLGDNYSHESSDKAISIKIAVTWFICFCIQASESSGVSLQVKSSLRESIDDRNLLDECWSKYLELSIPEEEGFWKNIGFGTRTEVDLDTLKEMFDDVYYIGKGLFSKEDGHVIKELTVVGQRFFDAFFLGNTHLAGADSAVFDQRGDQVFRQVTTILKQRKNQDRRVFLMGVVAFTVLYDEVASCRPLVASNIREGLDSQQESAQLKLVCHLSLDVIVSSMKMHSQLSCGDTLQPIIQLFEETSSSEFFCDLVWQLSGIPQARPAILVCASEKVQGSNDYGWLDSTMIEVSPVSMVQAGLFALIELCRTADGTKESAQAWALLSDCLVLNFPPLSLAHRSWLYDQIMDLLVHDELDLSKVANFQRAGLCRAAKFCLNDSDEKEARLVPENTFLVWEDSSTGDITTRQQDDLSRLLRLHLSLLYCRWRSLSEDDEDSFDQDLQGHSMVVNRILCQTNENLKFVDEQSLNVWFLNLDGKEIVNVESNLAVVFLILSVDYILTDPAKSDVNTTPGFHPMESETVENMLQLVVEREKLSIEALGTTCSMPLWIGQSDLMSPVETDLPKLVLAPVDKSILDIILEYLCGPVLGRVLQQTRAEGQWFRVVAAVGTLLLQKSKLNENVPTKRMDDESTMPSLSGETVEKCCMNFFHVASEVLQHMFDKGGKEGLDKAINSIILFCNSLDETPETTTEESWAIVRKCWLLYQVIGSDKAAERFLGYLEAGQTLTMQEMKDMWSLRAIKNRGDVDKVVHDVRSAVLAALKYCLRLVSTSLQSHTMKNTETQFEGFASVAMRALARDLRHGLDGHSGGITMHMYELFVACIQECMIILQLSSLGSNARLQLPAVSLLADVGTILRDVVNSFPLQDHTLFRSTLSLAISDIPSIIRTLWRRSFFEGQEAEIQYSSTTGQHDVSRELFQDCLGILTTWSVLRDPNSLPWLDILGKHNASSASLNEADLATLDVPRIVRVPDREEAMKRRSAVALSSKQNWSWALSCVFIMFEEKWIESISFTFHSADANTGNRERLLISSSIRDFYRDRCDDLDAALHSISRLFDSPHAMQDDTVLDILAMNMPSAPRIRLCHCLATVAKITKVCVSHIIEAVGRKGETPLLPALEAMTCLVAWLREENHRFDFAVGTSRWLKILNRKKVPSGSKVLKSDEDELKQCLIGVSFLAHGVFLELKKLEIVMSTECTSEVDSPVPLVCDILLGNRGRQQFMDMISKRLKVLKGVIPEDYQSQKMPDFPTFEDAIQPSRKKKRRSLFDRLSGRQRKATLKRSRNEIVNEFMRLDEEAEGKQTRGDGFVDLEKFLVPG